MNGKFTEQIWDQINDQTNHKGCWSHDIVRMTWLNFLCYHWKEDLKSMETRHLNDDDWIKGFWHKQLKSMETLHRFLRLTFQGLQGDKT